MRVLLVGLLLARGGAATCVLELVVSTENSVLDVGGTLGSVIDIELQGVPPQASGARVARAARALSLIHI